MIFGEKGRKKNCFLNGYINFHILVVVSIQFKVSCIALYNISFEEKPSNILKSLPMGVLLSTCSNTWVLCLYTVSEQNIEVISVFLAIGRERVGGTFYHFFTDRHLYVLLAGKKVVVNIMY